MAPWGLSLGGGLALLLIGPFLKRHHRFSFGLTLAVASSSLWLAFRLWMGAESGAAMGMLLFDPLTYLFVILFLLSLILTVLLSWHYLEQFGLVRPEYYALLLFALFGMGCMVAGSDLIVVFLGLEILSVALYVLAGFRRSHQLCIEASLKYFLIGAFASAFLLLGIAFLYGATGTTDLLALHRLAPQILLEPGKTYLLMGMALLAVGFGFKLAIVPFHFWAADVYEGAPIVVTNFMATAVKLAGFAALLRVVWALFQWSPALLETVVWVAAILTMTLGNLAALIQKNLKRMLAYSSIAHAGYALIPLTAFLQNGEGSVASICFYLTAYLLMTAGAFAVLIALTQSDSGAEERCTIKDLAGLGIQKPFFGFAFTILMLSLAGIPPTIGFFGKYFLFLQAVEARQIALVVIAVINSVISVYYYLGPVVAMYFGREVALPSGSHQVTATPLMILSVIWICTFLVLGFGLFPNTLLDFIRLSLVNWL